MNPKVLLLLALPFLGCATLPPIDSFTPDQITAKAHTIKDSFKKTMEIKGMTVSIGQFGSDNYWFTAGFNDNNPDQISYYLMITTYRDSNKSAISNA